MRSLEEIRENLGECDRELARLLTQRMECVSEIIAVKRQAGIPILQPEQEKKQQKLLEDYLSGQEYRENILGIYRQIVTESKHVQSKALVHGNIAMIGFMGTGKTTVSACLKDMLAMDVVEMDELIVQQEKMSINDIFAKYGEEYFRNCESNTIIELQNRTQTVISCGGGAVLRPANVENLKKHSRIVLLTASPETILERLKDSDDRPILNGNKNVPFITSLMEKRRAAYEAAADVIVNTDGKSVVEVCEEIITKPISSHHTRDKR